MKRSEAVARLSLTLPEPWQEVASSDLTWTDDVYAAAGYERSLAELERALDDPDLAIAKTATLFLPLHDDEGVVVTNLIVSLLAVCVPVATCPSPDSDAFAPEIRDEVPIPGGGTASFFTMTLPVISPDSDVAALLTFSSPNTPLAGFLADGFRSIAASARLTPPGEAPRLSPSSSRQASNEKESAMRGISKLVPVAVAAALAAPVIGGTSAQAALRPLVAFKVSTLQVDAGGTFTASYSVGHVPPHSKVLLQRTVGTARVWKTEVVLVSKTIIAKYAGSVSVTAPQMGSYGYRVVVLSSKNKALVAAGRNLHVYGDVPLATILNVTTSTEQIGTTLFRYASYTGGDATSTFLHFDSTTCRSASLIIAADNGGQGGTVSVIQETADPFSLSVGPGLTAAGTVPLSGGAADFDDLVNPYSGFNSYYLYVNGTLSCYTPTGTIVTTS